MKISNNKNLHEQQLREAAESQLANMPPPEIPARLMEEILHELRVHQIELEMQNEALRQAQITLGESRDRYVDLFEFAPVGYLTITRDGLIAEINLTAVTLLGRERNRLLNKSLRTLVIAEEQNRWVHHFMAAKKHDKPSTVELSLLRGDGTVFQAQLDCIRNAASIRISLTDITQRKLSEQLIQSALQKIEVKELAKTRFLAAASHDLRQPIAAASLFVEALKLTSPTPSQSKLIARLDQSMGIFSGLLERLLDISKLDAGLVKPKIASFNLADLFIWLEQNFAQAALDLQLRFCLFFPMNKSLVIRTDIVLLQSVLMNLINNAIKFTVRGGILISARPRGDRVLLQVWDTGIGIAEPDLFHIFDEFFQVDNPQRNREAGLGLGLSICQRTMFLLGGKITCRSHVGRGSVFEFSLPLNDKYPEVKPLPNKIPVSEITDETFFTGKRVVVLEDDPLVADGMITLLQEMGAEVQYFHNAEEALQQDDYTGTDFFIVDFALGGEINGIQFLNTLQQKQPSPLRAVVITGDTSSQFLSGMDHSLWVIIHKPINLTSLQSSLRNGC